MFGTVTQQKSANLQKVDLNSNDIDVRPERAITLVQRRHSHPPLLMLAWRFASVWAAL